MREGVIHVWNELHRLRQVICQTTRSTKRDTVTRQKDVVFASGFSELDDNIASVLPRTQILKSCKGVFESENFLVNDWLEIDLVLCEEIAQILLIFCRSDADAPGIRSVALRERKKCKNGLLELGSLLHNWKNAIRHVALIRHATQETNQRDSSPAIDQCINALLHRGCADIVDDDVDA